MESERPSTDDIVSDQPPAFGCDCIKGVNEALAAENTRLVPSWLFNTLSGSRLSAIRIETEIVQKKRGARPYRVFPTYCPFCGSPYRHAAAAQPAGEAQP